MRERDSGVIMRLIEKLAERRFSGIAIQKLEQIAVKIGVDEKELFELYVKTKNSTSTKKFADTPYSQRILFLPQCLRARKCAAEIGEHGYECQECGKCKLKNIIHLAKTLGYKGAFILPGGSIAKRILLELKPKACLGVACFKELVLGSFLCEKIGVIGQSVALLRDGCVETNVDWKLLNDTLHL